MKKTIIVAAFAALAINASAQGVSDALRFGQNEYFGTARSVALGNAMTALGGDLGSVQLNPAGSAVNSYSQFTITPSLNILTGTALYSASGNVDLESSGSISNSKSKLTMPNIGVMMNYKTHRKSGLLNVSFGIVGNATSYFNDDMSAGGTNRNSSYMGYLGALSTVNEMTTTELSKAYYNEMPFDLWPTMVGYRSGMIFEDGNGGYMSPVEDIVGGKFVLAGPIDQSYGRVSKGNRYDMVVNFGMNFSNRFFIGANLGIVDLDYSFNSYIKESAQTSDAFPVTISDKPDYFQSMKFRQGYSASGSGIYAKIGIIAVPVEGLRLGATIQTPTANYITERAWFSGETEYAHNSFSETIYDDEDYLYNYKFVAPARYSVGAAYTIPGFGLISADYELADFSTSKFRNVNYSSSGSFDDVNNTISRATGAQHMLRVGAEYTPLSNIAFRVGYNLTTCAERAMGDFDDLQSVSAPTHAFAFGAGYKSAGSFFCDAAVRCSVRPYEYLYPYPDYDDNISPEIRIANDLWSLMLTFGWRF